MSFCFGEQDNRKKEFVAVRMEKSLFLELRKEADKRKTDLSSVIRELCKKGLKVS